ncbi:TetR/AcrR family transcriptional regulator [Gordonia sp. PDNC005]|uniref:TetR/AcrR family transcriptional regulator n=1 Tax=unclassified Gordonia (in: high G+C Gram-positive bacteria) TaxID=2657482 RepID=UPI001965402E|nr:TetR/AcrR family transcriptional regulator [Gordonia sp. PDNC005]QRY63205.1 TetR/AcrR family transcriptional regulator [Gordonia sp. PDNC005]
MTAIRTRSDELLDAALSEFVAVGYATTGVKEITAAAGVSHGTFYNYFENRRQMLAVLVEREFTDFFALLDGVVAELPRPLTEDSLRDAMTVATRGVLELVARRTDSLRFILIDVPGVDQDALDGHLELFRRMSARFEAIVTAGVEDGIVEPTLDLEYTGQAWTSCVLGAIAPIVIDDRETADAATTSAVIVDFLLYGSPTGAEALRG